MDKTIEVENNLDWLNPDVLLEFIDKLREAGYSIGISQYIAAQDLILILISQGENFDNPERLRNLLAPIFCSSQLEQENFKQYFDDSFKSVSQNIVLTEKTTAEDQTSLEPEKVIKPRSLLLILPLIVIIFPGIPLFVIFNNVLNKPIVKPPNLPTTKPTNIPTKTPNIIPATKPTNIPDKNSINCTENIPPNTINWPRELAFFLTPAALFLISRMWWFWLNRQLFLRRYGTTNQPELQNISIADFDIEQELFPTMIFMQIARNLRRRIPIPSNQLDIEKTIDATLRQGGWLKPIYRNYQILPEYLFLVNRTDAVEFCNKLNQISQKTGRKYRLPSEAEWEYACRAGTNTPFHFGKTITSDLANYYGTVTYASEPKGQYRQETTEVGSFSPNSFGLYDMHGNVWEWCQDDWHDNYTNAPNNGTAWTGQSGNAKLLRGGSCVNSSGNCRSANRLNDIRDNRLDIIGFRVVCFSAARTL